MARRILVTGATGLLGPYLLDAARSLGTAVASGRGGGDARCDLTDPGAVLRLLRAVEPDVVIHAAALTDVDLCQRDPDLARRLNAETAANLARALPDDAVLALVSTDQVYPDRAGPHEEDGVGPVNVYGRSKLEGEQAVLARPNALVLRTNLFGPSRTPGRRSLSDWAADAFRGGGPVTLFTDSFFSPLHMTTLAALVAEAVARDLRGVFNLGSRDGMSKAEFALAVAARLGLPTDRAELCEGAALPARAPRPRDMRMAVTRLEEALGRRMPTLAEEIARL